MPAYEDLSTAAKGLAQHPQDHGWRGLYGLFDHGLRNSAPGLTGILVDSYHFRPISATHLLTLLGIALKLELPGAFANLVADGPYDTRLAFLEACLAENPRLLDSVLKNRQNSFTCARRFLLPQIVLSSFFPPGKNAGIRFADLGTGLGILPRQLNSRSLYERFSPDLSWPGGIPEFRELSLTCAFSIDRGPLPDLHWVSACYGQSDYYSDLFTELQCTLGDPAVQDARVHTMAVDLMDTEALADFLRSNRINAANISYVLYEMPEQTRKDILRAVVSNLDSPGILMVTEPSEELHRQGCLVELYQQGRFEPMSLCFVSDGHFIGHVIPLDDYHRYVAAYPIRYSG
jgi:hypothetical protein